MLALGSFPGPFRWRRWFLPGKPDTAREFRSQDQLTVRATGARTPQPGELRQPTFVSDSPGAEKSGDDLLPNTVLCVLTWWTVEREGPRAPNHSPKSPPPSSTTVRAGLQNMHFGGTQTCSLHQHPLSSRYYLWSHDWQVQGERTGTSDMLPDLKSTDLTPQAPH